MYSLKQSIFVLVVLILFLSGNSAYSCEEVEKPKAGINSLWYCYNESDTVFVFVHGILSDSSSAWQKNGAYWPELVRKDPRLESPSIYLGGFYTSISSNTYDMRAAANELIKNLSIPDLKLRRPVIDKPNIIFIAHSTGGIVVRHMLTHNVGSFKSKKVGLVLIASPSLGSKDVNRLKWLLDWTNNKMGRQLLWNNDFLVELDRDFNNLVDRRSHPELGPTIPELTGVEILETKFITPGLLFNREEVVTEISGARYFGEPIMIGGKDHFGVVKPNNTSDPVHTELVRFYLQKYRPFGASGDGKIMKEAYKGWIKAGQWGQGHWVQKVDARMTDLNLKPADIQLGTVLNIGASGIHFVNVRYKPPIVCNPDKKWFEDRGNKKTEMPKDMKVKVQELLVLKCDDDDQIDIWTLVSPVSE